jgi:AcrR family transcriptional regulator
MEQRIIEKTTELFFRYGLKGVTMDDIASSLGVSKKTIYQYYSDKDSLVDAVVQAEIDRGEMDCNYFLANAIHEIFMEMDRMQEMMSSMNPFVLHDMQKYHPQAFKKFNEHKNKFMYQLIKQNIERGKKEELYRTEINADILAKLRLESIFLALNTELYPPAKYAALQVSMEILNNFIHGIITPKGLKQLLKYTTQSKTTNNL